MNKPRSLTLQTRINQINDYLRTSPDDRYHERSLMMMLASSMLMESKSYTGFNYIYWTDQGHQEWIQAGEPILSGKIGEYIYGPKNDETRIFYY